MIFNPVTQSQSSEFKLEKIENIDLSYYASQLHSNLYENFTNQCKYYLVFNCKYQYLGSIDFYAHSMDSLGLYGTITEEPYYIYVPLMSICFFAKTGIVFNEDQYTDNLCVITKRSNNYYLNNVNFYIEWNNNTSNQTFYLYLRTGGDDSLTNIFNEVYTAKLI